MRQVRTVCDVCMAGRQGRWPLKRYLLAIHVDLHTPSGKDDVDFPQKEYEVQIGYL